MVVRDTARFAELAAFRSRPALPDGFSPDGTLIAVAVRERGRAAPGGRRGPGRHADRAHRPGHHGRLRPRRRAAGQHRAGRHRADLGRRARRPPSARSDPSEGSGLHRGVRRRPHAHRRQQRPGYRDLGSRPTGAAVPGARPRVRHLGGRRHRGRAHRAGRRALRRAHPLGPRLGDRLQRPGGAPARAAARRPAAGHRGRRRQRVAVGPGHRAPGDRSATGDRSTPRSARTAPGWPWRPNGATCRCGTWSPARRWPRTPGPSWNRSSWPFSPDGSTLAVAARARAPGADAVLRRCGPSDLRAARVEHPTSRDGVDHPPGRRVQPGRAAARRSAGERPRRGVLTPGDARAARTVWTRTRGRSRTPRSRRTARLLATAGGDGVVRLWSVPDARPVAELPVGQRGARSSRSARTGRSSRPRPAPAAAAVGRAGPAAAGRARPGDTAVNDVLFDPTDTCSAATPTAG